LRYLSIVAGKSELTSFPVPIPVPEMKPRVLKTV
jgi:hypothetical protein